MRLSLEESRMKFAQGHHPRQEIRDTWAENDGRSPFKSYCSIPLSSRPDFLLRAANDDHVCGSP